MALVVKDRVRETSTSSGTGNLVLNGVVAGFQSFAEIGNANTTYYTIVDAATGEFEVGIGTYTLSTTTLSRDTVLESSDGGAAINFTTNVKDVFVTYPAERSVYVENGVITPAVSATLPNTSVTGLGTISTQDADDVSITGGAVSGASITTSTADINGGSIDGVALGTNSAVTEAQIDNINIDGNTVSSTNTDGDIVFDPNGTGVVQENVDGVNYNIVSQTDIGTAPNEIPLNQYLGSMAYQSLENVIVGNLTVTGQLNARQELLVGSFVWNSLTSTPDSVFGRQQIVTGVHDKIRGCVLKVDGTVNYYLNPETWAEKDDGTASDLTGTDGDVMVEIPKFYYRVEHSGTKTTWKVSAVGQSGYKVHPAFIKDGVEVDFRYYSAYDACVYDESASDYLAGLNLDNNSGNIDTAADKLASVKGVFPMVGLTRNEFRLLAANVGAGWRQVDFTLWSAVQMLFLIEHQSFYSQDILGAGNTNGGYLGSSADQNDSPHTIAGAGDSIANGSTDTTSGAGVNAKPGTSFMKYRGIENFYGNCWNWVDGINVNVTANGNVHVTNNVAHFADDTSANMELITSSLPTASGFIRDLLQIDGYFLSSNNSGGSSTTFVTDQHFASTASDRVVRVGGNAVSGAGAGVFFLRSNDDSSVRSRGIGGRLAY